MNRFNTKMIALAGCALAAITAGAASAASYQDLPIGGAVNIADHGWAALGLVGDGGKIWRAGKTESFTGIDTVAALSGDGLTAGGFDLATFNGKTNVEMAAYYRAEVGVQLITPPAGTLGCGSKASSIRDINKDGTVMVGHYWPGCQQKAFKWTKTGGYVTLSMPADHLNSSANAVSSDGNIVVGFYTDNTLTHVKRPIYWKKDGSYVVLNQQGQGYATAVNKDGTVIAGIKDIGTSQYFDDITQKWITVTITGAFRWTASTGFVNLGKIATSDYAISTGISADGKTIVGYHERSGTPGKYDGFIWIDGQGIKPLKDHFVAKGVVVPAAFNPGTSSAEGISTDGQAIVGTQGIGDTTWLVRLNNATAPNCEIDWDKNFAITAADLFFDDGVNFGGYYNGHFYFMNFPSLYSSLFPNNPSTEIDFNKDGTKNALDLYDDLKTDGFYNRHFYFMNFASLFGSLYPTSGCLPLL